MKLHWLETLFDYTFWATLKPILNILHYFEAYFYKLIWFEGGLNVFWWNFIGLKHCLIIFILVLSIVSLHLLFWSITGLNRLDGNIASLIRRAVWWYFIGYHHILINFLLFKAFLHYTSKVRRVVWWNFMSIKHWLTILCGLKHSLIIRRSLES